MLCVAPVALPIGELDMPSLMMHINDPATIKFMAGVSGAPAVTAEVPLLAAKPKPPPQRSALWEYQDTKIALPDRPSCHDMAATGDCDTNKNYMLSQCALACQARGQGPVAAGVAPRSAPAAAAAKKPPAPLGAEPASLAAKPAPLAGRPTCHDMAAAGDCSTNKAYMLSQCILACQAVAAGGVAARPAPAAAAAKPRVPLGAKPAPLAAKKPATLTAEPSLEPSSPVPNMEAKPMKNVGEVRQAQSLDLAQDLAPAPEPKYGHQIADEIGDLAF
jgi:hypothetical protein